MAQNSSPSSEDEQLQQLVEKAPAFVNLPQKTKQQVLKEIKEIRDRYIVSAEVSSHYSGPIPPSHELANYENLLPGSASRIIAMAEKQAEHRIGMESRVTTYQMDQSSRGQWMAFTLATMCIAGSIFLTCEGYAWVGGTLSTTTVLSLVGLFLVGKQAQRSDLQKKSLNQ